MNLIGVVIQFRKRASDGTMSNQARNYIFIHLGFILTLFLMVDPVIQRNQAASLSAILFGIAMVFFGMIRMMLQSRRARKDPPA